MTELKKTQKLIINLLSSRIYIQIILIFFVVFSINLNTHGQSSLRIDQLTKLDVKGFIQGFNKEGKVIIIRLFNSKLVQNYEVATNTLTDPIPTENTLHRQTNSITVGTSADLTSIIIKGRTRDTIVIQPLGKNDYINVSLSPDESKILFRVSGMATYVCDLKGDIIHEFKGAEFPIWISDQQILFAKIEDDGYQYLSSDLFIYDLEHENEIKITENIELIPLYPAFDVTTKTLGFSTPDRSIYLSKIK